MSFLSSIGKVLNPQMPEGSPPPDPSIAVAAEQARQDAAAKAENAVTADGRSSTDVAGTANAYSGQAGNALLKRSASRGLGL
jgi:hypothetical protein